MLGQGQVEAQSLGWRQRRAQEPGFPSLSLLHLETREPPGPQTGATLGVEDEPCSSQEERPEPGRILPRQVFPGGARLDVG